MAPKAMQTDHKPRLSCTHVADGQQCAVLMAVHQPLTSHAGQGANVASKQDFLGMFAMAVEAAS